ncbi:MAG: type II CRISPR-associated endonuclease Cas1 [Bacteroidota bacterium]
MIKRTLYFGNPAYLRMKNSQLEIRLPQVEKNDTLPEPFKEKLVTTIPIEDIGVVVIDHHQITITHSLIASLLENNVALITCNNTHHPTGLMLNLSGNTVQTEKFKAQIETSLPMKKQLWQQTIIAKITNQANHLKRKNVEVENMFHWADSVKSGDAENHEARAAAYYWKSLFSKKINFTRERFGEPPNNLLNYGYAILRAIVARGLVGSGLLPTLGIHHHNKYNAYCLADDIMEPYRPFVDETVCGIMESGEDFTDLTTSIKKQLLEIPTKDIFIGGETSPLMVGIQRTTASLAQCFEGVNRKIIYPEFV